jgi:hypothetical protein
MWRLTLAISRNAPALPPGNISSARSPVTHPSRATQPILHHIATDVNCPTIPTSAYRRKTLCGQRFAPQRCTTATNAVPHDPTCHLSASSARCAGSEFATQTTSSDGPQAGALTPAPPLCTMTNGLTQTFGIREGGPGQTSPLACVVRSDTRCLPRLRSPHRAKWRPDRPHAFLTHFVRRLTT